MQETAIAVDHKLTPSGQKGQKDYIMNALRSDQWKRTSKIKTSPSATFGKSARNSDQKKVVPGPGSYDMDRSSLQKGVISFKGSRKIRFLTESPGPCAYQPKQMFTSKKYSFQKRQFHQKMQMKPSPTSYNPFISDQSHGNAFGKNQREKIVSSEKEAIPGPGKYEKQDVASHKKFSFTKTRKFVQDSQQFVQKEKIPGPGTYEIANSRLKIKSGKFTKALRNFIQNDKIPGPGSYTIGQSMLNNEGGIIAQQKRQFNYQNETPGPGKYKDVSINLVKKKEGAAVINKSQESSVDGKQKIPGPGSYFKNNFAKKQKILGGTIGRDKKCHSEIFNALGPLSYKPNFDEILSKTGSVIMGKQKRLKDINLQSPGPGYYEIQKRPQNGYRTHTHFNTDLSKFHSTMRVDANQKIMDRQLNATAIKHI